jgi:hypothetical protein
MVVSETAKLFCFQTPGDGEAFYLDASDPLAADAAANGELDLPRLQETAARNATAVQFLGPPPFVGRES